MTHYPEGYTPNAIDKAAKAFSIIGIWTFNALKIFTVVCFIALPVAMFFWAPIFLFWGTIICYAIMGVVVLGLYVYERSEDQQRSFHK